MKIEGLDLVSPYGTISSTFEIDTECMVPGKIIGKVVKVNEPYPCETKYGPRVKHEIVIKDSYGDKQTVQMWRKPNENFFVDLGKVYVFSKLKTTTFPPQKPHFLHCNKDFQIELAPDDQQKKVEIVEFADGRFSGKIMGIRHTKLYCRCNICKHYLPTSFQCGEKCPYCSKEVTEINEDYSFVLVIESGSTNLIELLCYKRFLPIDNPKKNDEALEEQLCKEFEGKSVLGGYIKKKYPENGVGITVENITVAKK